MAFGRNPRFWACWLIAVLSIGTVGSSWGQDAAPAAPAEAAPATPEAMPAEAAPETAVAEPAAAAAAPAFLGGTYDTGSIAWLLVSAALVCFMMPGLALFYGGMVRAKNVLNMYMCVMVCVPIVAIQWVAFGYSMAFAVPSAIAVDAGKNDDGTDKPKLSYLGWDPALVMMKSFGEITPVDGPNSYGKIVTTGDTVGSAPSGVPELLFAMFQMMFAIITPALIVGAIAERVKFSAWCVFVVLWATIVYDPVCHWVWNVNGFLFQKGVLDFAGGTVVHVLAGVSALALILILPKRRGYLSTPMLPHSIGWTLLGAGMLMVGWFGFNAGSAVAVGKDFLPVSGAVAVMAFAATAIAGSAATGSWMLSEWIVAGKPTALGVGSGMVAGLVVITPCAGHVSPGSALIIGLIGGVVCFFAVQMKQVIKYDDSLDVVGVHGVGGALGALLVGLFAVRPALGGMPQFMLQLEGVLYSGVYAFVCTLVLGLLIHYTIGFTVNDSAQEEGLDVTQHGEVGYHFN
ncbi:MAG: ammonium transporter [Planctomycetaceae bacterium]|nr:ammonium transporter [Planctomycetaceae bacterium]